VNIAQPATLSLPLRKARVLLAYRGAAFRKPALALRYLLHDREVTNFTYDIDNVAELEAFVCLALGRPPAEVKRLLAEPAADLELLDALTYSLRAHPHRNPRPLFGRRLGWYAVIRALKPGLVVETGVHDGLGSSLLLRALERNAAECAPGRLIAFDVDPSSGWLVEPAWRGRYELVIGDVRRTLAATIAGLRVGVFIHDSLHTYEHERFEFEVALQHVDERFALISDNAHATTALADLCRERRLRYAYFRERPREHFYPGAGIGLGIPA